MKTDQPLRLGYATDPSDSKQQREQPIRLRSGLPTNLELARFILTGLRYPSGSGADRVYEGASLLVITEDGVQPVDVHIGDRFTVRDQNWRLDTALELEDFESAALISRIQRQR